MFFFRFLVAVCFTTSIRDKFQKKADPLFNAINGVTSMFKPFDSFEEQHLEWTKAKRSLWKYSSQVQTEDTATIEFAQSPPMYTYKHSMLFLSPKKIRSS